LKRSWVSATKKEGTKKEGQNMGYILLGHGGLDVDPAVTSKDMEFVAIPQGTTIQFYADAGQGLVYGSDDLDIWEQLKAPWPALDSSRVTYNLCLYNAQELWDEELKNNPQFGGHELIRAGVGSVPDPLRMCTGTRATCPTDPRDVARGATHTCDGILGTYQGDLYWLACTSFSHTDRSVTDTAMGGSSTDVVLGADPDWIPAESDQEAIAEVNRSNVKDADDDDVLSYVLGGFAFLIGDGHDMGYVDYAAFQSDTVSGKLTVHKGGVFSSGSLDIENVPPSKQGVVEAAVARFSDKEANFV
jgi:hypothetical protein